MQVWGTAGTERGRLLVLEQGAHRVFDHGARDYLEQIRLAAGKHGVDVILEMVANRNLANDLTLLALHGRVVVIGSRGNVEINPRDIMSREADIRGMVLFNTPPGELAEIHAQLFTGLSDGTLHPVIAEEYPLVKAPYAHGAVMDSGAAGKIVLIP
jgi:NADPH2:quinone reductase